jgi:hypothetical protein
MERAIVNNQSVFSLGWMRFFMGFLFALGFFMVELGISRVLLVKDVHCKEVIQTSRLLQDPKKECLPEGVYYFLIALSRGPFASTHSEVPSPVAWMVTGIIYAVVGGSLANFAQRFAAAIYLGFQALALVVLTFIAYLSNFIV